MRALTQAPAGLGAARSTGATIALAAPLALATAWCAATPATYEPGLALIACVSVAGLAWLAPARLLLLLVAWLSALGLIRRLLPDAATLADADAALLVAPFGLLMLVAATAGSWRVQTPLGLAVGALGVLVVLGAVNPLGESLQAGVAGLLFVLSPMLAFPIGRCLVDDRLLRRVLQLVAGVAVAAALYGLWQTHVGFPRWDAEWIQQTRQDYRSLNVLGELRPFASFSSATEYGFVLAIGIVIMVAYAGRAGRLPLAAAGVGLLGVALLYQSSRAALVLLVVAIAAMAAARARVRLVTAAALGVVALGMLVVAAERVAPTVDEATGGSGLVRHQVEGVANPLDPESSTVLIHLSLMSDGFASLRHDPAGIGLGPVTVASAKYGGIQRGTEADPSNVAVALGIPGLLIYAAVVAIGLSAAYRVARRRADALALVAVGVLIVTLFQWLNGGQYAVAYLPWLILGWVDRQDGEARGHGVAAR